MMLSSESLSACLCSGSILTGPKLELLSLWWATWLWLRKRKRRKRGRIIGAAAVTGGTLLTITGGLAAPAKAAGMGTAVAGSAMGSAAVASTFGAAGAGLNGMKMARRMSEVDEFQFETLGSITNKG